MFKNQSRTVALLAFASLLFLVSCTSNSSKQVNSAENASVEVDITQANRGASQF